MDLARNATVISLASVADQIFDQLFGDSHSQVPTVGDHAYRRIWIQLITGARRPSEHLSDVDLASELGVSRTPVRQALHRLTQEELVRADPRRGFWVREFTAKDVCEFYDVRAALETLALRQGAARLSTYQLESFRDEVVALRERLSELPVVEFLQHDFRLHSLIINASGNGRLIRLLASLRAQVSLFQIRDTGFPNRIADALDGHDLVLDALLSGDFELAAVQLGDHIEASKEGAVQDLFNDSGG